MLAYKQSLLLKVVSLYVIIFLGCSVSQETREVTIVLWKPKVTFEDFDAVKARYSNSFCEHDDKNYFKIRVKLPLADARSHEEIENEIVQMLRLVKNKDVSENGESLTDKKNSPSIETRKIVEVVTEP
jgi:hypothetical protein